LITGASAGIGRATAHVLAADGADVAVAARREERLEELAAKIEEAYDVNILVVPTDVTDEEAVDRAFDRTVDAFGRLDAVVANAGLGIDAPIEEMSTDTYRTMMDVNVDGMFFTARAAIPHLRETEGTLVFLGSFSGQYPRPQNPIYAATKWWTRGFARSLEASVGADNVAVTVINPTEVRTQFGNQSGSTLADEFQPGEVTEPIEVAEAISFAVRQRPPNVISSIDIYRRDKMTHF
jgi:NADP-dependent 3-hydroxy acid dehydrogenase YdfG